MKEAGGSPGTSSHEVLPFALCGGVGIATLLFPPFNNEVWHFVVAGALFLLIPAVALVAPDTSRWQIAPPLIFFVVIAVVRDGSGGVFSGLASLVALPILWVALYRSRLEIFLAAGATGLVFLVPLLLIGAPAYPASDWRRAVLWTLIAALVGPAVHRVVERLHEREQAQVQLTAQVTHLANHDPLTGLASRRIFYEEFNRHLENCKRYGPRGALLMMDLDHFKEVNDSFGHGAGDQLLISVADLLRLRLRKSDMVARLGGDEFAVLLPEADPASAEQVAADIVHLVRDKANFLNGSTRRRHVTASIGVVLIERTGMTANELVSTADLTMYAAKESGRDRYAMARHS